jgi:histidinol-phosphatase (PHP family)
VSRGLPLDAHLHTDASADADVPIDAYAARARAEGVAEICITDHLDFDPADPNHALDAFGERERVVRDAAERWSDEPRIRFGVEITYERRLEPEIRGYLAEHRYDYAIGSVHVSRRNPLHSPAEAARWCRGKSHREASAWYWPEVEAAIRSGLFDTIGHLDFVKRYLVRHLGPLDYDAHADLYESLLVALVETGTCLEVNSSGLRQEAAEAYPPPAVVARFRRIGGQRVVAGSDAHRLDTFGFGLVDAYRSIVRCGYKALTFRRAGARATVELSRELVAALDPDA